MSSVQEERRGEERRGEERRGEGEEHEEMREGGREMGGKETPSRFDPPKPPHTALIATIAAPSSCSFSSSSSS